MEREIQFQLFPCKNMCIIDLIILVYHYNQAPLFFYYKLTKDQTHPSTRYENKVNVCVCLYMSNAMTLASPVLVFSLPPNSHCPNLIPRFHTSEAKYVFPLTMNLVTHLPLRIHSKFDTIRFKLLLKILKPKIAPHCKKWYTDRTKMSIC